MERIRVKTVDSFAPTKEVEREKLPLTFFWIIGKLQLRGMYVRDVLATCA